MGTRKATRTNETFVTIRRIHPNDAPLLLAMYRRSSAHSLYQRYLAPYKPTLEEVHRLSHLRGDEGAAFVAVINDNEPEERVVGVAHYIVTRQQPPKAAEVAFLVEDEFQGQGIGQRLCNQLSWHAMVQGIHTLQATVDAGNQRMMRLFKKSNYPYRVDSSYGANSVQVLLDPSAARAAMGWFISEDVRTKWAATTDLLTRAS